MLDEYSIEVEVRGQIKAGYRLKVSLTSIGIYMDGFTARESSRNTSGYWIQPPAREIKGKWVHTPEFSNKTELWQAIEQACIDAINEYERDTDSGLDKVYEPSESELNEPINLDDIDFGESDPPKAIPWMDRE